ncbi:hypothetical protein Tco_0761596 [Tanacetum coccineum]
MKSPGAEEKAGLDVVFSRLMFDLRMVAYVKAADVVGIDVPLTQSQPTKSTQGTHRTPSALDPVPTVDKEDEMILQDTLQVSLAEHKSQEEQEARENVELVNKQLASVEIEKTVEGPKNVIDDSSVPRNDDQNIPGTRLEPKSEKESLEVKITNDEEVKITNVVIPVNVNEEEEEITDEVYELKRREKGKIIEESRSTPFSTPIRSHRIHTDIISLDTEKLQELTGRYGYLFEHLRAKFLSRKSFDTLADHLQEIMVGSLPTMVDKHIKEQVKKQVPEQVKVQVPVYVAKGLLLESQQNKEEIDKMIAKAITLAVRPRDQDDPHDDAHPKGENSAKRQKTSEYEAQVTKGSSGQVNEKEQGQSYSRNQEQTDDYDFWTESYASNDDEILTKQVSQDIIEEVSLTINEAELKKIADEMLRQRCTSGDEHQYHIDQMKNFLKSDIVWESRKEIITSTHPRKTTPLVQSCSSGPEKIVLSLHKFPTIIFNDVDIEERTSRWVNKQKDPGKPKEVVPDYAETGLLWSLLVFIRSSVIWERVHDFQLGIESYQQKVNLTAPTISFLRIKKHKMFSIIYKPVHGIIYKNSKKEKRVIRHSEIHKFCDATLNRVLEGLKSYNNDVKYGYIQRDLNEDKVEYLKLFAEEIEVRLKYCNQMRRWEMYVNGRPLRPRREHPL